MKESENSDSSSYFSSLVQTCELVRSTSSKNQKIKVLADYLSTLKDKSLQIAVLFLSGRIFPRGSQLNLNLGFRTIMQSLNEMSSMSESDITKIHLEHGDIGSIAEFAISKKEMVTLHSFGEVFHELNLTHLNSQFIKIAQLSGPSSLREKKNLLKGMLIVCSPLEAKYLVKIITNEMRIGSYEGLVESAIAKAFDKEIGQVREAMLLSGDIANVALFAKQGKLNMVTVKPFIPMSFMLADVMYSADEITDYFGKPLLSEFKYDGIRVQAHRFGNVCRLFSRNLSDITFAFPEISASILEIETTKENNLRYKKIWTHTKNTKNYVNLILDGELIAWKDEKPLPFFQLQKRLRKKSITDEILSQIPVRYIIYDIMFYGNNLVIKEELRIRRNYMNALRLSEGNIRLANSDLASSSNDININFKRSRKEGHEGLVIKDPTSQYHPGRRGRYWVKLKEELDTIDAVVVLAEYGHGKRAGTLSDYTLAIKGQMSSLIDSTFKEFSDNSLQKDQGDNLKVIGKAYSGLSDEEIAHMTNKLKEIVISDKGSGLIVKPEIVLEVTFDTIHKSNRHSSGFALRFPRIKNIRYDKSVADIDSIDKILKIYENQYHIKGKSP